MITATMESNSNLVQLVAGHGSHYSIYQAKDGMGLLKAVFPNAAAKETDFCLFSTSGVHGTYQTIEGEESDPGSSITFLIVQPRLVTLHYGVVYPATADDFEYLKRLRQSSWEVVQTIGAAAKEQEGTHEADS